jgi:hypothetical protein
VDDEAVTAVNNSVSIVVVANDTDPDDYPVTVQSITQPAHGSASFEGGIVTYTPATGFEGIDSLTYVATDGRGGTDTATVTITVGQPQLFAGAEDASSGASRLTAAELGPMLQEAVQTLANAGIDTSAFSGVTIHIRALPGRLLGVTYGSTIWLDANAAGHGWLTAATPDDAFGPGAGAHEFIAQAGSDAADRVDLRTVLMHELMHVNGVVSVDPGFLPHDLMTATIGLGVRRTPWDSDSALLVERTRGQALVDAAFSTGAPVELTFAEAASVAASGRFDLPARATHLPFDSSAGLIDYAGVLTSSGNVIQQSDLVPGLSGAGDSDVLIGGTGCDILISLKEGADVLVGGIGSDRGDFGFLPWEVSDVW